MGYKLCESLYCALLTYIILYISYISTKKLIINKGKKEYDSGYNRE